MKSQYADLSIGEDGHRCTSRCRRCLRPAGRPTRLRQDLWLGRGQARPSARAPFEKDVLTPGGPRRPDFQCAGAPCGTNRLLGPGFLSLERLVRVCRRSSQRTRLATSCPRRGSAYRASATQAGRPNRRERAAGTGASATSWCMEESGRSPPPCAGRRALLLRPASAP